VLRRTPMTVATTTTADATDPARVGAGASGGRWSRRLARSTLTLVGAAVLVMTLFTGTASATGSAIVDGGEATVYPRVANVCAFDYYIITIYWAEAIIPGREIGGKDVVVAPGVGGTANCEQISPKQDGRGSSFRHFHICNNLGKCSDEVKV
jgi:hypothetical protein